MTQIIDLGSNRFFLSELNKFGGAQGSDLRKIINLSNVKKKFNLIKSIWAFYEKLTAFRFHVHSHQRQF